MTDTDTPPAQAPPAEPEHPAKWNINVLGTMHQLVDDEAARRNRPLNVLDPFAGVGRAQLADALNGHFSTYEPRPAGQQHRVWGLELQELWADPDPMTIQGDVMAMRDDWTGLFDVIATSPCYGNRMADNHDARDACRDCLGSGCTVTDCLGAHPDDGQDHQLCPTCKGHGLSWRNTYTHSLRRQGSDLIPGSAAAMQWGPRYRLFHADALVQMERVLVPGGLMLINVSNHLRDGEEQQVVEWWVNTMLCRAYRLQEVRRVGTRRQRYGVNGQLRVDGEVVVAMRTPGPAAQGRML